MTSKVIDVSDWQEVINEVTHNGDKGETYLDVYIKWDNCCVKD